MNKDVLLLTIPRTLTKNPVPLHLQHQGTHNFVQKNKSITENRADFIIAVMGDSNQCELLTLG